MLVGSESRYRTLEEMYQGCTHRLRETPLYDTQLLQEDETMPSNKGLFVRCREARSASSEPQRVCGPPAAPT